MDSLTTHDARLSTTRARLVRAALWLGLLLVLALGFVGYLMPGVSLSWDTLMAMCGF